MRRIFLILLCVGVSVFAQSGKPALAVYVTGYSDIKVMRVLAADVSNRLIRAGQYSAIERSSEFFSKVFVEETPDNSEVIQLCKEHNADFFCTVTMTQALEEYYLTAKVFNFKTLDIVKTGSAASPLKTMDDVMKASADIANSILGLRPANPVESNYNGDESATSDYSTGGYPQQDYPRQEPPRPRARQERSSQSDTAETGGIYAFGLGVGFGGGFKTNSWDIVIKERMGAVSDVEGTLSIYYKDWDDETYVGYFALMADIVYLWRWNISGGINWHVGPLISIGLFLGTYPVYYSYVYDTEEFFYDVCWGIGAQVGVEHDFNVTDVPLVVGLNIRPEINIAKPRIIDTFTIAFHFGVTYTFK